MKIGLGLELRLGSTDAVSKEVVAGLVIRVLLMSQESETLVLFYFLLFNFLKKKRLPLS